MDLVKAKSIQFTLRQDFYYVPEDRYDDGEYHPSHHFIMNLKKQKEDKEETDFASSLWMKVNENDVSSDKVHLGFSDIVPLWNPGQLDSIGSFIANGLEFRIPKTCLEMKDEFCHCSLRDLFERPYDKNFGERLYLTSMDVSIQEEDTNSNSTIHFVIPRNCEFTFSMDGEDLVLQSSFPQGVKPLKSGLQEPEDYIRKYLELSARRNALRRDFEREIFQMKGEGQSMMTRGIEDMDFTVRTYNWLKRAGILTVGDLVNLTNEQLMKSRNLGRRSINEIKEKCYELGLQTNFDTFDPKEGEYILDAQRLGVDVSVTDTNAEEDGEKKYRNKYDIVLSGAINSNHLLYVLAEENVFSKDIQKLLLSQLNIRNYTSYDKTSLTSNKPCGVVVSLIEFNTNKENESGDIRGRLRLLYPTKIKHQDGSEIEGTFQLDLGNVKEDFLVSLMRYAKETYKETKK